MFHFDDEAKEQRFNAEAALSEAPIDSHLYVCGPGGFIDYVLAAARDLGWAEDKIHFERFTSDTGAAADDEAFDVCIASSGEILNVPADKSVLEVLEGKGIELPMSCEQGLCGTCVVEVLEGTPDHKDHFLTDEEKEDNDQIVVCCSRSKTDRLVLDI